MHAPILKDKQRLGKRSNDLGTAESVGVVAQQNFNNIHTNTGTVANVVSPTAGTLVDNLGLPTTATLTFSSNNSYASLGGSSTGTGNYLIAIWTPMRERMRSLL